MLSFPPPHSHFDGIPCLCLTWKELYSQVLSVTWLEKEFFDIGNVVWTTMLSYMTLLRLIDSFSSVFSFLFFLSSFIVRKWMYSPKVNKGFAFTCFNANIKLIRDFNSVSQIYFILTVSIKCCIKANLLMVYWRKRYRLYYNIYTCCVCTCVYIYIYIYIYLNPIVPCLWMGRKFMMMIVVNIYIYIYVVSGLYVMRINWIQ